jgi:hypothetical protein
VSIQPMDRLGSRLGADDRYLVTCLGSIGYPCLWYFPCYSSPQALMIFFAPSQQKSPSRSRGFQVLIALNEPSPHHTG